MIYGLFLVGGGLVVWGLMTLFLAGCEYSRRRRRGDWSHK